MYRISYSISVTSSRDKTLHAMMKLCAAMIQCARSQSARQDQL